MLSQSAKPNSKVFFYWKFCFIKIVLIYQILFESLKYVIIHYIIFVTTFFHSPILFHRCQEKIPTEKSSPWGVRGRVMVRLGIGLGLRSGGFFPGRFFLRTFFIIYARIIKDNTLKNIIFWVPSCEVCANWYLVNVNILMKPKINFDLKDLNK